MTGRLVDPDDPSEGQGGVALLIFSCVCGRYATANPELVPSIPARWDAEQQEWVFDVTASRQPLCRFCAQIVIDRARAGDLTGGFPAFVLEPGYLDRAYGTGAAGY